MIKKYILAIMLGSIAGVITVWAFDSFSPQEPKYFAKAFLSTLLTASVVLAIVHSLRKTSK
jgi:uncharacterized membrane protein YeaQ/YmgE (transglycosylase-associated protein family)